MKILTALNSSALYNKLNKFFKSSKNVLLNKDIVYKEGILEFLKTNNDINILVLNTNIEGTIDIYFLIKEVLEINKYIEIIAIINKEDLELRKFLSSYNINKVLIEGEFYLENLVGLITNDQNIKQKLIEKEIDELRKLVFEKNQNTWINKINTQFQKLKKYNIKLKQNNKIKSKFEKNKKKEKENKKENKNKNEFLKRKTNPLKIIKNKKIYFTLSEELQKYNIDSIDITINIKR